MAHKDITVTVTADGPQDLHIVVSSKEAGTRAELHEEIWDFTIPKDVWKAFMTLAPGFTRTVRLHTPTEDK